MAVADNFLRLLGIAGFALALSVVAASAQGGKPPAEEKPAAEEPAAKPSNAPYMKPLSRLATVLGSLHFLRGPVRRCECRRVAREDERDPRGAGAG